ncbi:MAG: glycosyltransferase [Bacteroides intestinalis]|nr:glycosyltransferase [Bacteroides intestinalis]
MRKLGYLENVNFQSTSEEETRMVLKWLTFNPARIFEISNIPSLPKCSLSNLNKISGEIRVVFVSRIVPKKNLLYALNILSEIQSCVIFDIYGAKEDKDYWKNCEDVINKLPANIKVTYKGVASHDEIHSIFVQYHVFFFPTFSENYGHVIAEAFSVGCYVLTSDQVPWLDMNEYGAGNCVSLDNRSAFKEDILRILELNNEGYAQVRENCIAYSKIKLNIEDLRLKYNNMFESICLS